MALRPRQSGEILKIKEWKMETREYHEAILKKVSFDEELLKIELKKAVRNTTCSEQPVLLEWCGKELGPKYKAMASSFMKDKDCAFNESDS